MRRALIVVAAASLAAFGCGGSQPASNSQQSGTAGSGSGSATGSSSSGQPTDAATAMQQAMQGMQKLQTGADGKQIQVVDFEKLLPLLPDVPGWEKGKPDGNTSSAGITVSTADVRYTKGDMNVKVTITDAALNQMLMLPYTMAMGLASERSTRGYNRPATIAGQPGREKWDSESKHAEATVVVNKRFIVQVEGSDMDSPDPMKEVLNKIDFARLAELK